MNQQLEIEKEDEQVQEEIQLDVKSDLDNQKDEEEQIDLDINNEQEALYNHVPKAELPDEQQSQDSQDNDGYGNQLANINTSLIISKRQSHCRQNNNYLLITYDNQKKVYHILDNHKIKYPDKTNQDFQRLHLQLVSKEFYMEAWIAQEFTLKKQFIQSWIKTLWIQYTKNSQISKILKNWLSMASYGKSQISSTFQKIKQYGKSFFVRENKNKLQLILQSYQLLRKCSQEMAKSFKENVGILGSLNEKFISHPNYVILKICDEIKHEELQFYKIYSKKKAVFIIQKYLQSKGQKLTSKFDKFKSQVQLDEQKITKHKILEKMFSNLQK